jgi:hypothetical protein
LIFPDYEKWHKYCFLIAAHNSHDAMEGSEMRIAGIIKTLLAVGLVLVSVQAARAGDISNTPPVDENLPGTQACYSIGAGPVVDPCLPVPINQSQSFDYTDLNGADYGTASGNVGITGGNDPSVSATAVANGAVHVDAWGYLWYAFEITAPAQVNEVPILLTGTDSVSGSTVTDSGGDSSSAQILVCSTAFSPGMDPVTNSLCSAPVYSTSELTNISDELDLSPGEVYEVELYAEGEAGGQGTDAGPFVGNGYVDPTFSLDLPPGTPGYSIAYGPGLFPTSAPEPGSIVLLSGGLVGIGLFRRKRVQ